MDIMALAKQTGRKLKATDQRQHGFDTVAYTYTDSQGAAPERERSLMCTISLVRVMYKQDGAFIVRRREPAKDDEPYAISVACNRAIRHVLIRRRSDQLYAIGTPKSSEKVVKRPLFHRRTRASYVYNGCLAWYNVVLTDGSTQA